ncbi:WD repeat domain phosphoinositide-interacting protein 2 [Exaiptasia diaphana]|nr:WD repeat domain phosphoinositide-interacting protein 2 [Exaiptasia diaphana]KXJ28578.1 WD repeat domain phosphoinositide-interacting protein 2 [Exaiptasia diaphana]
MNLAAYGGDPTGNLLFVNFNQDCSSLAVGEKTGYKLYSLGSVEKLEEIYEYGDTEDICIVERLFSSSLVAIVSLSAPRKLKVCHFKKGTEICNYSYPNTILAVKLNRVRLLVVLEESLYIHNIRDMKVLHTIRDTPPNTTGLSALSVNSDNCYLAYPGSNQIGEVQIFDAVNLRAVTMIPAHDSTVASMAFNNTGTKLATASEKGTVIRVFSIPDALSPTNYLPSQVTEVFNQGRAFANVRLPVAVAGALLRAALVASCFLGAFPPVDLRAVCLVRAILI